MKKLTAILLVMLMIVISGCQRKETIVVTMNVSDGDSSGGMMAEMEAGSTLKDLFDEYVKGAKAGAGNDFSYEIDSEGGIISINGKKNDENGYWEILVNGTAFNNFINGVTLNDGDVCDIKYYDISKPAEIVGGWETADIARVDLSDEEADIFNQVMEGFTGAGYEPVCVIATQVVSGTNYAYLARGTTITADPVSNFYIIKIYKDLSDNVSITSINEIDVTDIKITNESNEGLLGGWTVTDTGRPGTLGSDEAESSYEEALKDLDGVIYNPVQLLATQLVAGTNYKALSRGRVAGSDSAPELYVIEWYVDLNGNSTLTSVDKLDLNYYVQ